ncbi:glycosyltransferase family 4 protein [Crenobacter cavernae]|uniref:Glycosyltransferase family 1 protein n=1 Tax=Crenobacter cavernae TaxID=2290923 RepID=A0ABY0FEZ3_9NEIS|nr:glycosyltransferase family 4 protein [Crenobacter cavernae]RXZ43463.1 glycosyltransferase family 1 protein [Crenobacter cavernae]
MIKKIALSSNTAWSLYNFRHGLISTLLEKGVKVIILAPKDECSEKLAKLGCQVIDLNMSAKGVNPVEDIGLIVRMARMYRRIRPDFIIHYTIKPNIYGSIAAKLAGVASIAVTTGLGYTFVNDNLVAHITRQLYKQSFRFPKEVWFLNNDDRQAFLDYRLVDRYKAMILHSEGINATHFAPQAKPVEDGRLRFLLIARMLWDKGVGEFVEAARHVRKHHPNVVFQLLGACSVPNPSVIGREQIAEWEKEGVIEYLGSMPDVRPMIAQADCMVLPSYREGVPRTLMEAASMAKPLIATNVPGCRDVIREGETGLLCHAKNAVSLAACIERVLAMSAKERQMMGEAGRRFMIERFDEQRIIDQYMQTLERYMA